MLSYLWPRDKGVKSTEFRLKLCLLFSFVFMVLSKIVNLQVLLYLA